MIQKFYIGLLAATVVVLARSFYRNR